MSEPLMQIFRVPEVLKLRASCRQARELIDAALVWTKLETEMNAKNSFNIIPHSDDNEREPFIFRTMLREQKRELAMEISKLSSSEREAVVRIIKKERLYGKSMQQLSLAEIERDLDSLAASTQSEIVVYMQGNHPDMQSDDQEGWQLHNPRPFERPRTVKGQLGWYELWETAKWFVGQENELAAAQDPRIYPSFAALSPFMRCRKLFAFLHTSVLRLQAFRPFKPPFDSLLESTSVSIDCVQRVPHSPHSPSVTTGSPSRTHNHSGPLRMHTTTMKRSTNG